MCERCQRPLSQPRVEQLETDDFDEVVPPCDLCRAERELEALEAREREGRPAGEGFKRATLEETAELDASCEAAKWVVYESQVDFHYCRRHADEMMAAIDSGLGSLFREAGLQQAEDYLPIAEPEKCNYAYPPRPEQVKLSGCDQPAVCAHMALERDFVCDKHVLSYSTGSSQQE